MIEEGRPSGTGPLGPEFELIDKLTASLPSGAALPAEARRLLQIGIGDDAAVWEISPGELGILTVDTMVETVHTFAHEPPEGIGGRALTSSVSDVSAMGGTPLLAVVALQVPTAVEEDRLLRMYDGIHAEAGYLEVAVVGGDVVDTPGPLAISIAVFGRVRAGEVWTRGGAQPGDVVAVTGDLGGSRAGVELLELGEEAPADEWARCLIERHIRPHARVRTVRALSGIGGVNGGIDISDGLSSEAWHLALGSGVTIRLEADAIPVNPSLDEFLKWRKGPDITPAGYALDSGEEFELLLTLPADNPALREEDLGGEGPLTVIGRVETGGPEVILEGEGGARPILPGGWSHRLSDVGEE